jgi:hypothetical protein
VSNRKLSRNNKSLSSSNKLPLKERDNSRLRRLNKQSKLASNRKLSRNNKSLSSSNKSPPRGPNTLKRKKDRRKKKRKRTLLRRPANRKVSRTRGSASVVACPHKFPDRSGASPQIHADSWIALSRVA